MDMSQRIGIASYSEFRRIVLPEGTLLVTSALTGEGKTFIATELAVSKALRLGNTQPVLFIDLNSFNRHGSSILLEASDQQSHGAGLVDVLLGKAVLEETIRPTRVARLFVLPFGDAPVGFEPLQYVHVLKDLIQSQSGNYTIVIDSSSVFIRNRRNFDPVEVARIADTIVLVVQAGKTPREVILRSKLDIESNGGTIEGIVMNDRFVRALRSELAQYLSWLAKIPLAKTPVAYLQARLGIY